MPVELPVETRNQLLQQLRQPEGTFAVRVALLSPDTAEAMLAVANSDVSLKIYRDSDSAFRSELTTPSETRTTSAEMAGGATAQRCSIVVVWSPAEFRLTVGPYP